MSRAPRATPTFDELFDAARRLGTAELLLELRPDEGGLWLRLVRLEDGRVIHERAAVRGVEVAATEIRALVEADSQPRH
ncbi:MAG: hypothetical protein ACR2IN_09730 [Thermoleophilaceae bacterium]